MSNLTDSNPLTVGGKLDDFLPRPRKEISIPQAEARREERELARQSAQELGFSIDNLSSVVRAKRMLNSKPSKSHTLRLYIQDVNRFQTWCNDNDYSQAKGFEILLDKLLSV